MNNYKMMSMLDTLYIGLCSVEITATSAKQMSAILDIVQGLKEVIKQEIIQEEKE